jgi:uncharacterized protein (TIGR02147 family)
LAEPFYRALLRAELAKRCEKNPNYSLRSFARTLDVDVGAMSRILAAKKALTFKATHKILDRLALPPRQRQRFIQSVIEEQKTKGLGGDEVFAPANGGEPVTEIDASTFQAIANWYHYAIMEMTFLKGFQSDPRWIARELGISPTTAKLAVDRLLGLGLLKMVSGRLKKGTGTFTIKDKGATSAAHRAHHRQTLEMAIDAMENVPFELRNMSSMTIPIDPKKLPAARKLIEDFSVELTRFLAAGPKTKVYQLSVNLFPLQKDHP